jgi:hypothetical protein
LKVNNKAVLVATDVVSRPISSCSTPTVSPPAAVSKPCSLTTSAIGQPARRLKVNGKPVALESVSGQTDGLVSGMPQNWSVSSAGQSRLTTV